ncbi:Homoserine dehydrogenase [Thermaerobacter marianensis DSM 12885]|uniref:Homoserine dehydrogenase n=1 Tax=Thermaerobacter marianensis (strain ATCC 700841 / DSM 12885 / JCM 10246 / 7p75a) TaxID=644966 RepID=E6SLU9_THEM7|nr:homoserine dehydrogenase [Thermaerobacter marianensis]ADU51398.1 Homoserine dehydrogenase [Thermaerobacter marianensis DSM 12885]
MKGPTVALLGLGTVGSAVARQLLNPPPWLVERLGGVPRLKWVLVRCPEKPRPVRVDRSLLTTDPERALGDPEVDVVIELIGGVEPARQFVVRALEAGRSVVTANKALLAESLAELAALARRRGVELAFEGAVAGGVPIIRPLLRCLAANRVRRLRAVLNGTCNYVLTLVEQGATLEAAVRAAQEAGYAEADPSDDLSGRDAARKLAILAMLVTGEPVDWTGVRRTGLDDPGFRQSLAATAERPGTRAHWRLVASADWEGQVPRLAVQPELLPPGDPLLQAAGVENMILIEADPVGTVRFAGPGAGGDATASAVLADLIAIWRGDRLPLPDLAGRGAARQVAAAAAAADPAPAAAGARGPAHPVPAAGSPPAPGGDPAGGLQAG